MPLQQHCLVKHFSLEFIDSIVNNTSHEENKQTDMERETKKTCEVVELHIRVRRDQNWQHVIRLGKEGKRIEIIYHPELLHGCNVLECISVWHCGLNKQICVKDCI